MNTKLLRQKILDLAIRGKLTEQKKSDGTTKDLLKQIQDERTGEALQTRDSSTCHCEAQKRRGNLKQSKSATPKEIIPLDKSEAPFEIPENWEWVRLDDISALKGGKRVPAGKSMTTEPTSHIYIRVTDMRDGTIFDDDLRYVNEEIYDVIKNYTIGKDDLYITIAGTIGRVGLVPEMFDGMNLTENALKITDISIEKKYLMYALQSHFSQDYFESTYHQVAMPKLSLTNASKALIPLPPLAEQQRIVTAIENAFAEITEIENNQELLKKHIKQGRQKILDLAIRGKLTQQLKTDGTTKDLLAQMSFPAPTGNLVTSSSKKKGESIEPKQIVPLDKTTAPFEIPSTWEWVKLGDICGYGDCDNVDVKKIENDAWILELEDIEKDSGKIIQHFAKSERAINGVRHSFKKGDILYSKLRTYLNKVLVAPEDGFCTTEIMPIKTKEISNDYLCLVLRSQYFLDYTTMCGYGVKMPRLSTADAKNGLIPLPPLAEQQRIVATIEQAFAEFDAMEKHYS